VSDGRQVATQLAQVAIATPRVPTVARDPDVDYWVTVVRKILQRGVCPPLSPRLDGLLPAEAGADVEPGRLAWLGESDVDASWQLDPRWERPFWDRARLAAPHAAAWLIPQAPLEPLVAGAIPPGVGRHWVDFLYAPPGQRPTVIEIDGAQHVRRAEADRERDRLLAQAGIPVVRAPGADAVDPGGPVLRRFLEDEQAYRGTADPDEVLAPAIPHRLAMAVVEAVRLGLLPKGGPWSIEVHGAEALIERVAGPSLDLLRAVSEVWRLGVVPHAVQVNGREWRLSGEAALDGARPVRRPAAVRIRLESGVPYFAPLSSATDLPEITVRPAPVPAALRWLPGETVERRAMRMTEDTDLHLRLLVEDLFGHASFREGQLPSLRQALRGGDSVVLLPTGTGKSLIYQLAGLLMPGTTIVVDPLVSLIDDQKGRLLSDGIDRVVAVHASRAGGTRERDSALDAVARGEPLFLFVTPERLQNQRFRDNLRESAQRQLVSLAVIDEAHTVSEWGHDFRTSYLRLARNIRRLCRDRRGSWPAVLALTGTAGPAVLRDVLRELEIDADADGALQRPASHDRPNLHFRKVTGDERNWLDLVVRSTTVLVPRELGVPIEAMAAADGSATLSGIVFCPWARGAHGVEAVRDAVVSEFAKLGVKLEAETYSGKSGAGLEGRAWAERKARAAEDFKANRVPILVATKAFGMGIDKPNIRYTVHAGFPSSIEAFAQEAGRAGRDGADAICVLTASLSEEDVAATLLDRSIAPEVRRRLVDGQRRAAGDLGRQLFFFGNSFPGADEEADLGMRLFDWLADRGGGPGETAVIAIHRRREEDAAEHERRKARYDRALFRLAALGIVDDLTVDGPEITVHFASYSADSVDAALLAYLSRIEPGMEWSHAAVVGQAPNDFRDRVAHHLRVLANAVYRIVADARLTAIANMRDLAAGPDDPAHIRSRINGYLGDGPAATILANAIAMSPIDVPRFVAMLDTLPAAENDALIGAAARQQEAYPDHPLLWLATAYGTAREPGGTADRFGDELARALAAIETYRVDPDGAAEGVRWLLRKLRTENDGARWAWVLRAYQAWDAGGHEPTSLAGAEADALALAATGQYLEDELGLVVRRRLQRHAHEAATVASALAGAAPSATERPR